MSLSIAEEFHFSKQKIVEFIPNKKVVWLVTDSRLTFVSQKSEWTGTIIIFDISEAKIMSDGYRTKMQFTHMGLVPKFEYYGDCSNTWEQLVQQSLFSLITTGKGKKVF